MRVRSGFTLVEVLVTLILIGVLIGVVLPAVVNQLDRGDHTRIAQDLEAIRSGARLFRVDVKRYPATMEQLTEAPDATATNWVPATDIGGGAISGGLLERWDGPYIEGVAITDTTVNLETALGGQIKATFTDTATLGGVPYLTVEVADLSGADILALSELIDGDTDVSHTDAGGRVRGVGLSTNPDTLYYLAIPLN